MKKAKQGWKPFLAAFLMVAMLAMMCAPSIKVLAADAATLPEPKTETGEGWVRYHAEHFYTGNRTDSDKAADMQPSEQIEIPVNAYAEFGAGKYTLSLRTCGDRASYEVLVDGASVGTITREGSGWGDYSVSKLEATLELKADSVITIKSPASGYGWVDYVQLDTYTESPVEPTLPEPKTETGEGWVRYHAEHFYTGNRTDSDKAADMQPSEQIEIPVNALADFVAGKYTLSLRTCGDRASYEILVDGTNVGTIAREGSGWGDYSVSKLEATLELKADSVITIKSPASGYGWVDYIQLDTYAEAPVEPDDPNPPDDPVLPEDAVQSGEGWYQYQVEYFYDGNINENAAADLQPGEVLEIPVGADFVEGEYTLTVRSCGNRETFEILVNGQSVGTVARSGNGFGMDQMTDDKLAETLTLKPGDMIGIKAPSGEFWGWVDSVRLDVYTEPVKPDEPVAPDLPDGSVQSGDGWYQYQVEYFYDGNISENAAADLQPGEVLEIPVGANFVEGEYTLTIRSCGNRESFEILVNGQSVGTLSRKGTGFGMDQMTDDKLTQTITLKAGDVIGLKAPSGEFWGWVESIALDMKRDLPVGDNDRTSVKIQAEDGSFAPESGKESGTTEAGQTWISGFQNMTASYMVPDSVKPGLYRLYLGYVTPTSDCSIAVGFGGGERTVKLTPSENADAWNWNSAKLGTLVDLYVKPGDTFTIRTTGSTPWVQIDYFLLVPLGENGEPLPGSLPDDLYSPATGDEAPLFVLGGVMLLSAAGVAGLVSKRKYFI